MYLTNLFKEYLFIENLLHVNIKLDKKGKSDIISNLLWAVGNGDMKNYQKNMCGSAKDVLGTTQKGSSNMSRKNYSNVNHSACYFLYAY